MSDADHLKRLISIYRQGLQIRQEQLARAGSTPDPSIILDIERLETTIAELQQGLKAVPGSDEVAPDKTWNRGYRYLKAEYSYRFSPDDIRRQEFRSKVQLEALRDGVDIIKKYCGGVLTRYGLTQASGPSQALQEVYFEKQLSD